ncbi:DNRLRE domain-containing protein [Rummeliibacillus stabekisii]|uniref:DNRLRE domain-containing protein n=1 Tax=Rummeliibacillus stabekisii TaxID=241244 RepID=UPI00116A282C|nr:DNRLRE domain-containing protein [Rummeliibacillus stabekisii]MBB5171546.1 RHS repeat-associated protein [Rummeliibacillus stabekisii]GEL05514.1 tRNA nuclease WapA [Rummeliibacillus stabekisii]
MNKKFIKSVSVFTILAMLVSFIPQFAIDAFAESNSETSTDSEETKGTEATDKIDTSAFREIKKERTETTKTFKDNNGNYYKEIYSDPIHKKDTTGYEDISENLTSTGTGYVSTEKTSLESMFPQSIKSDSTIEYKKGDHSLEFTLNSALKNDQSIAPTLKTKNITEENKSTYEDIYPQIDLRHITFNEEVKEDWIVKKYTGIHQFKYTIQTDLIAKLESDGSISFKENANNPDAIFTLPRPMMMDSNIDDAKGEGVYSDKVHYELTKQKDNTYELTLNANEDWLASSKRVYPVYIDPSVSTKMTATALGDTYVTSKYPTANFNKMWDPTQGEYVLQTGYYDATSGTNYAFIKFDIKDLKGATIDQAQLSTYVTHAYYASEKNGLWVDAVNDIWHTADLTWNNKPSSTKITSVNVGRDEWANFNVTGTVQSWMSGETRNNGFKLHTNGHGKTYWKKISAEENANKPKITVSYHYEDSPKPTVTATAYNDGSNNGYTDVKWKSVYGATGYKLLLYDGAKYEEIYSGSATSWTSKGKKIFPKGPYKATTTFAKDGAGVEFPDDPSGFFAAKGTANYKEYKFRVVAVYPTGDGPQSEFAKKVIPLASNAPERPIVTGYQYPETDNENAGRGWLDIKWKPVANATGYKILIWNGTKYEVYTVGKATTSISTKGKKLWPTDAEVKAGSTTFHQASLDDPKSVGTGAELPMYPGKTYGNTSKRFSIRIIATSPAGDSERSDINYGYIPLYPPKTIHIASNEVDLTENKTSLTVDWNQVDNANFYDVTISGEKTGVKETFQVKNALKYTTKKLFDIDDTYTATVQAYYYDDSAAPDDEEDNPKMNGVKRSLSPDSSKASIIPNLHEDLLGIEDYFTYDEQEFGNATANVNVTTENMVLQFTDESLYTRSDLGYDFIRTYNSRSTKVSSLGKGWTFNGNESLTLIKEGISYTDEDGTVHLFEKEGDKYKSPQGLYETLEKVNDTTYKMTDNDQFVQTFKIGNNSDQYFIASYQDEYGNQIDFTRNNQNQLIMVSETKGIEKQEKIQIEYTDGKISKVKFADHWTTYTYNGDLLVQTKIGSDHTTSTITENFFYDDNGQLTKYKDGENNLTVFSYKENELTIFDQQANDQELSITNTYQFNDKENEFKTIATDASETVYRRDKDHGTYAVTQVTEPSETNNNTTLYLLEGYNILRVTYPDGKIVNNTYDSKGNVLTSTSTEGTVTNTYNEQNQLEETVAENGETTKNTYVGPSLIASTVKNETTKYEYDSYGRETKITYPNGTFDTTTYDDDRYTVSTTDKEGNNSNIVYTVYGQQKEVTDADGHTTKYTYDPLYSENITSVTDGIEKGSIETDENSSKTTYSYDDNNNISSLTDALGRTKTYSYNDNDQVTKLVMPQMTFQYVYDLNGELSISILPSEIATFFSYNEDDQVDKVQIKNKTGDVVTSTHYQYDDLGNVSQVSQDDQILKTYGYTDETNLLSNYGLKSFSQSYQYDEQLRLTDRETTYNNTFTVNEQTNYKKDSDDVGYIKYGENDEVLHDYQYNQDSSENQNTVTLNNDLLKQVAQFNDANLLASLTYTSKEQQPFEIGYDYTNGGNILKETIQGKSTSYEYDGKNQLKKETFSNGDINTYEYDKVGNRTAAHLNGKGFKFSYNDANQIEKKNDIAYQYDIDGNLLQDEHFRYTYNEAQSLKSVQTLKGDAVASYTYDETGLRLTKTIGDTVHEYFYNNEVLDMEVIKKNGEVTQYRYYEWNDYKPLGMVVKDKATTGNFQTKAYQFITNQRGDVLSIRDQDDKEVGLYQYDAYGNVLSVEGEVAKDNSIRYAGYYYDQETKNYYLQARYYNAENGAFLSLDSHPGDDDQPLSQNGYNYASNNPIINTDPNGNFAKYVLMGVYYVYKIYKVRKVYKTAKGIKKSKFIKKKKKVKKYKKVKLNTSVIAKKIPSLQRIDSGLEEDWYHRACSYFSVKQLQKGRVFTMGGRDGRPYTHLKAKVLLKGQEGVVHYIINREGQITHQMWSKGTASYYLDTLW